MTERFLLYTIDDGDWHSLTEIAETLKWPMQKVIEATRYLAQGHLIHYDEKAGKVKIQTWLTKLPKGTWDEHGKRSTGTIVIAPNRSVNLQKTAIYNSLDTEVEIDFIIVDDELTELLMTKPK